MMVLAAFTTIVTQPAQMAQCIVLLNRVQNDDLYRIAACTWICKNIGVFENDEICSDFCNYALSVLYSVITSCDRTSPDFGILRSNCVTLLCSICSVFARNPSYFGSVMIPGESEELKEIRQRGMKELCMNPDNWEVSEEIENCGTLSAVGKSSVERNEKSKKEKSREKDAPRENRVEKGDEKKESSVKTRRVSRASQPGLVRTEKQIHTGFTDDEEEIERRTRERRLRVLDYVPKLDESPDNQPTGFEHTVDDETPVNETPANETPANETSVNETPTINESISEPLPAEPTQAPNRITQPTVSETDDWDDEAPIQPVKTDYSENWDESSTCDERTIHIHNETPLRSTPPQLNDFSPSDPFAYSPLTHIHNETPSIGSRLWKVLRCVKECWSDCVKEELMLIKALVTMSDAEIVKEFVMARIVDMLSTQELSEIEMNSVKECLQLLKSEIVFRVASDLSVKRLRELQTEQSIRQLVSMNLMEYEILPANWLFNNMTEIMLILFSPLSSPECLRASLKVYSFALTVLSEVHCDLLLRVTRLNVFLVIPPLIPMMKGDELLCLLRVCERVSEGDGFEVSVRVCVRMSVNDACDRNAMIQFISSLANHHKDTMKETVMKMSQSERMILKELLNQGMKEKDQKRRNKPVRLDFSQLFHVYSTNNQQSLHQKTYIHSTKPKRIGQSIFLTDCRLFSNQIKSIINVCLFQIQGSRSLSLRLISFHQYYMN